MTNQDPFLYPVCPESRLGKNRIRFLVKSEIRVGVSVQGMSLEREGLVIGAECSPPLPPASCR